MDYCRLFAKIEEDPTVIVQMTIKEYLGAKTHIQECDVCHNRVERVMASAPPATPDSLFGDN